MMRRVEVGLMESGVFRLPSRKKLLEANYELVIAVVDVIGHSIKRSKKHRAFYSGKRKRHTLKSQVVINQVTGQIVCEMVCH